ncbi:MAG: hypothetical protein HYZ75_01200 [Elusimicrobia bacterium]|nr:hypothetical protein [Elusimicrobiota bacterium]
MMKKTLVAALALLSAVAVPHGALLPETEALLAGRVTMLNPATRRLALIDGSGNRVLLRIPLGYDLTRIRLGDRLIARTARAVALALSETGASPTLEAERLAPKDEPAYAPRSTLSELRGRVARIDRERGELRILAWDGTVLDLEVPSAARGFEKAEAGDEVLIRYLDTAVLGLAVDRGAKI